MRKVEVNLRTLFNLIASAEDYGWQTLVPDFVAMCGPVTGEEIDEHAHSYNQADGYTDEDYEQIKERLTEAFEL